MTLRDAIEKTLVANELGGDLSLAYRFSDPDGVRTGRSGWSFGRAQFDLDNNPLGKQVLDECGFLPEEVIGLIRQEFDAEHMAGFDRRLLENRRVVDGWDARWVDRIIAHVQSVVDLQGLRLQSDEVFVLLADYHNQLDLESRGRCARFLASLGRVITPEDILAFKKTTAWGKRRPDDVERRYQNIVDIFAHARADEIRANHGGKS